MNTGDAGWERRGDMKKLAKAVLGLETPRDRREKDWKVRTLRKVNLLDNLVRLDT